MAVPMATDVLGVLFRLIKEHVYSDTLEQFKDEQIIRARQSLVLPPNYTEYCVLTLLSSIRHGTNEYSYVKPISADEIGKVVMSKCIEHMVQVDFLGVDPMTAQTAPMERASIFEALVYSDFGISFVQRANPLLSILYADDIQSSGELNESHMFRNRFSVTVHLNEHKDIKVPLSFINSINLKTENVDVHHKVTRA